MAINPVGYAELVRAFDSMADLDVFLKRAKIAVKDISRPAAYLGYKTYFFPAVLPIYPPAAG